MRGGSPAFIHEHLVDEASVTSRAVVLQGRADRGRRGLCSTRRALVVVEQRPLGDGHRLLHRAPGAAPGPRFVQPSFKMAGRPARAWRGPSLRTGHLKISSTPAKWASPRDTGLPPVQTGVRFCMKAIRPLARVVGAEQHAELGAEQRQRLLEVSWSCAWRAEAEAHRERSLAREPGDQRVRGLRVELVGRAPRLIRRPISAASWASMRSPSSIICTNRRRGTRRTSTAMIIIGKSPTSISGVPSSRSDEARAKVHAATMPEAAAHRVPVHLGDDRLAVAGSGREELGVVAALAVEGRASPSSPPALICEKSPPAQNALPAPVITTTDTPGSASASASAQRSSLIISGPIALRRSGLFRVMVVRAAPSGRGHRRISLR